jgi:hypothetical protein
LFLSRDFAPLPSGKHQAIGTTAFIFSSTGNELKAWGMHGLPGEYTADERNTLPGPKETLATWCRRLTREQRE